MKREEACYPRGMQWDNMRYCVPSEVWEIQEMAEKLCQEMECGHSVMNQLVPDRETVRRLGGCLCQEMDQRRPGPKPGQGPGPDGRDPWKRWMCEYILCEQMCRCRRQRK